MLDFALALPQILSPKSHQMFTGAECKGKSMRKTIFPFENCWDFKHKFLSPFELEFQQFSIKAQEGKAICLFRSLIIQFWTTTESEWGIHFISGCRLFGSSVAWVNALMPTVCSVWESFMFFAFIGNIKLQLLRTFIVAVCTRLRVDWHWLEMSKKRILIHITNWPRKIKPQSSGNYEFCHGILN